MKLKSPNLTKRRLLSGIILFFLLLALPVATYLVQQRQELREEAAGIPGVMSDIALAVYCPNHLAIPLGGNCSFSALAQDNNKHSILQGVTYEWGISSQNSIGTLSSISGPVTTINAKNEGYGDLWVLAYQEGGIRVNKSIGINVGSISPTPTGECIPVNKTIYVSPPGEPGNCHDVQKAIDNVLGGQHIIKLAPGIYSIPESGDAFSIKVINKNSLTIQGDSQSDSKAVHLKFPGNGGGILIQGSSGSLQWMNITGRTSNGLVYIDQSPGFNLGYLHLNDQSANTVQINRSSENSIYNSEIKSSSVALYPSNTHGLNIANNIISDSGHGIESSDSSGEIKYNLFENNREQAIELTRPYLFNVTGNTIIGSKGTDSHAAFHLNYPIKGNSQINFQKNIVVSNNGGIEISEASKVTYNFGLNNVWNNDRNYIGIPNQTGKKGNISTDPLFGPDYCLSPGSPAIYGDVAKEEYMGHRGPCGEVPTSTPIPCLYFNKGDANCNNKVDELDYAIWWQNYERGVGGDFNGDGITDELDYAIWWKYYGNSF